jgi:protoporphyrinogen oxidase
LAEQRIPIGEESAGTAVLGAGPAGLTAAHVLGLRGRRGTVFEADGTVGGIAKTVEFNGYRFDLGGHRFYTKLAPIQRLWESTLGDDFAVRSRLSRIYYRDHFFNYPLTSDDVFRGLGVIESARCALSYVRWHRRLGRAKPETFEDWVVGRFGRRIYDIFFRSYTEKVWGIPGSEIRSEWAAQRIQNFTLFQAMLGIIGLRRNHSTTLIEQFHYPRLGPGQMWEEFRRRVEARGIGVQLGARCTTIRHRAGRVESVVIGANGAQREHPVDAVLSSIPLRDLVMSLEPAAPDDVRAAAERLRYRHLCLIALITEEPDPFPDNWIYLHDPGVRAGRVQNFGAWSRDMVRPGTSCLGAEYFCFSDDDVWHMPDTEAVAMARDELASVGLIDPDRVVDGVKVRVPRAYPMYDGDYREAVAVIRGYLDHFENLKTFGRNGLHRYNNQDHSMWTAILATLNLIDGATHDVWSVNTKGEYLEEGELSGDLAEIDLVA